MGDLYIHPQLGTMFAEDTDWLASSVSVPFAPQSIEVLLAGEEEAETPSDEALAGYDWLCSHWSEVFRLIQEQAFLFYEPYRDAFPNVPNFAAPADLLGTEEISGVHIHSKDTFTISMRFAWQEAEDPHIVTFYIEDGECETHSVDG